MTSQSASAFIEQIKTEYRAVVEAEKSALPHAIKCGEFLKLAKENLKAERGGNWSDWLGIPADLIELWKLDAATEWDRTNAQVAARVEARPTRV
jgi:hypothetical protein